MIKPVFTEKSLRLAKEGKYSFWVAKNSDKKSIKAEISRIFDVDVIGVKTITTKGESKRNNRGRKITVKPGKKAIVTLKEKQKIAVFEESKNK